MKKRYYAAFQLSFIVLITFLTVLGGIFYFYQGTIDPLIEASHIILLGLAITFIFIFFLIQWLIDNFIYTKVRELYQDLLPTGIVISEESLEKDVLSITENLQKFAKENKLEIQLLKDKENYRREFIGNLAHELKTPLFTVQGYILTLLEGGVKDKETLKRYLKKAANGVDRLSFIINDLDLITQFETGITTLNVGRFDIVALIHEIFELFEIQAAKKEIKLICDLKKDQPIWVNGDKKRISQVITNLLVNSFKYGVENGTTEMEVSEYSETKVLVRVTDNGKGIEDYHLPRLFERFYRVEKTRNRNEGGSGLGLAIVKHIIEAHNEKVFVESTLNVGSEFSFTLPKSKGG